MEKTIDTVIQERLDGDTEFMSSISSLTDEEKSSSIESKRKELLENEFKSLTEKAEKATKAEELANNYKVRAEDAEKELKKHRPKKSEEKEENLSMKDFYALNKASVSEEDIDDVSDYAKFKGISVADALKSSVVKATLAEKAEARRSAQATQMRSARSQNTKPSGHSIVEDIKSKGEDAVPEPGSEEAEALFNSRRARFAS